MRKYRVLFVSSSSEYEIPEGREVYRKKFRGFGKFADIFQIAVSRGGPKRGKIEGAELYLLPKMAGLGVFNSIIFVIGGVAEGIWIIKRKRVNIVYAQSPLLDGLVGLLLKWLYGIKLIVGIHGDWEGEIKNSKPRLRVFLPIINLIAGYTLRHADSIRVISQSTRERAREFVDERRIFPIAFPALFDVEFFLKGRIKKPKEQSALFVGSLIGRKGVEYLIRATAGVVRRYKNFKVYVIGEGKEKKRLTELSRSLGIGQNVVFLGRQPAKVVRDYMDRCSVLVLPSLSEGLGRVALEAMARGRPVRGSQVEGSRETVNEERGYPVEMGKTEEIEKALISVIRSPEEALKRGRRGREYVKKNYSTNAYMKNYRNLFNFVLD